MPRAFLFVMDSVGVGGAPDAAAFGDEGADTLGHVAAFRAASDDGALTLPNLSALGLGEAAAAASGARPKGLGLPGIGLPSGLGAIWAVGREISPGKDTVTGHWELAGAPLDEAWFHFPDETPAFPAELTERIVDAGNLPGILGDCRASGTEIIERLGAESVATGRPILYTSADSVLQIAAHAESFGLERLLSLCGAARAALDDMGLRVGRVIARPFEGDAETGFSRTPDRRDFAVPPPRPTLCDRVVEAGGRTVGVGKIGDIFAGRGISEVRKGRDDMALFDEAVEAMTEARDGDLVFANFVEFDSLHGHRRDPAGYAAALEAFDARLPEALRALGDGDLLIVTADHGNDPTWRGSDHTRECAPILCVGPELAPGSAGTRRFADVGETLAAHLGLAPGDHGESFLEPGPDGLMRARRD